MKQPDTNRLLMLALMTICILFSPVVWRGAVAATVNQVPAPGMVTMVDLGAKKCIPCKMMAPVLEELTAEYEGRAAIFFIDVWENPSEAERFAVRAIPTQIFYDQQGNEVSRHIGFLAKKDIVTILRELGVE